MMKLVNEFATHLLKCGDDMQTKYITLKICVVVAVCIVAVTTPVSALTATCDGPVRVTAEFDVPVQNEYRLNGVGGGLPSATYVSTVDLLEAFVWMLPGPIDGEIVLEWRRPPSSLAWEPSEFGTSLSAICVDNEAEEDVDNLPGPPAANLLDGRVNNSQNRDVAAPVAAYCADGNVDIYMIDAKTGAGARVISVPECEGAPESNQLLESVQNISLYWLDSGEYQLNAQNFDGTPYMITWTGCDSASLTHR